METEYGSHTLHDGENDVAGTCDQCCWSFRCGVLLQDAPSGKGDDANCDNFQKAIEFYVPILQQHKEQGTLLSVTAMVIANLCVSYIMDEKNHEAEELMKQVEVEEERSQEQDATKQVQHCRDQAHGLIHSSAASA